MHNEQRSDLTTRATLLAFLSDEEVSRVSTAQAAGRLWDGDEYVDLENLQHGVRTALAAGAPMRGILPRKSVLGATWTKIVAELALHSTIPS